MLSEHGTVTILVVKNIQYKKHQQEIGGYLTQLICPRIVVNRGYKQRFGHVRLLLLAVRDKAL